MIVAYSNEEVLSAVPFTFPETAYRTTADADGVLQHEEIELSTSWTTVFLPITAEVTRVAALGCGG